MKYALKATPTHRTGTTAIFMHVGLNSAYNVTVNDYATGVAVTVLNRHTDQTMRGQPALDLALRLGLVRKLEEAA